MKILIALLFCFSAFAQDQELMDLKTQYEKRAFELKVIEEQEAVRFSHKLDLSFTKSLNNSNMECVNFVYQGASTREESIRACAGVSSMECVRFVYQGASSREESAQACRGVTDMECVNFAYRGPLNRAEAARSCGFGGRRPDRC